VGGALTSVGPRGPGFFTDEDMSYRCVCDA